MQTVELITLPKEEMIEILRQTVRDELKTRTEIDDIKLLSPEEVADILGFSKDYVYEIKNKIGFYKLGRKIAFKRADVLSFIDNSKI